MLRPLPPSQLRGSRTLALCVCAAPQPQPEDVGTARQARLILPDEHFLEKDVLGREYVKCAQVKNRWAAQGPEGGIGHNPKAVAPPHAHAGAAAPAPPAPPAEQRSRSLKDMVTPWHQTFTFGKNASQRLSPRVVAR